MAEMRAKFRCDEVTRRQGPREVVELNAVTDSDEPGEDSDFADASPFGQLEIQIDNPEAVGYFEPGQKYYLDFTEAPE